MKNVLPMAMVTVTKDTVSMITPDYGVAPDLVTCNVVFNGPYIVAMVTRGLLEGYQ